MLEKPEHPCQVIPDHPLAMSVENVNDGDVEGADMAVDVSGDTSALHSKTSSNGDESISQAETAALMNVLKRLVAVPLSDLFLKPVIEFYPEMSQSYLTVVKHPIDLQTLWKRLQSGAYSTREAGITNVRRELLNVFNNCILYNGQALNMQLVSIARHMKVLAKDLLAETGLPLLNPRESVDAIAMRRWKRRRRRYIDCWGIPANKSVCDAVVECFPEVSSMFPSLISGTEDVDHNMTFGDVVMETAQVAGMEYNEVPSPEGSNGLDDAKPVNVGLASLAKMIDVLFPAPKATSNNGGSNGGENSSDIVVDNDDVSRKGNEPTRWESLNKKLSEITIFMSEISRRGSEFSNIWARPNGIVWAKISRQHGFWPAIVLCDDSMPRNVKTMNLKRLSHKQLPRVETALKNEIDRKALESYGAVHQGEDGINPARNDSLWILVELLGAHDFEWVNGDDNSDIKQLTSVANTPNIKPMRKKLYPTALLEAQKVIDGIQGKCDGLLSDQILADDEIEIAMANAGWNEKVRMSFRTRRASTYLKPMRGEPFSLWHSEIAHSRLFGV